MKESMFIIFCLCLLLIGYVAGVVSSKTDHIVDHLTNTHNMTICKDWGMEVGTVIRDRKNQYVRVRCDE